MTSIGTTPRQARRTKVASELEDLCQVVLFNDDVNSMEFVVGCLMKVFRHSAELAAKIMIDAHLRGRAIAEVEGRADAVKHKQQLESFGLTAEVERL